MFIEDVSLWAALGGGLASFFTPCVLPMVPIYLGSLASTDIFNKDVTGKRHVLFLHSLSFVLGFAAIFTLMGAFVGLAGISINPNSPAIKTIAGGLLIFFGLFIILSFKIPQLNFTKRLTPRAATGGGYIRSFFTGAVFTIAWTPCVGPILGSVLTIASVSETVWEGAYLLLIFSIGLGIPFLIIGIGFDELLPVIKKFQKYSVIVYIISGILLILAGILIATGNMRLFV
ncbi:MAG: sulfite exporter TauE/SafE family protein [Chloroflexi bacterium]|nr:sulfite exporter TauE/SafE family protein [Chloroflexota bacterium]